MRPYLAIIKDSFRAAMASRVLYVLLLLITILLIALAPFHLRETLDWKLQRDVNVRQPDQLVTRIVQRREKDKPVARIWELLPEKLQKRMLKLDDVDAETVQEKSDPEEPSDRSESKRRRDGPPKFVEQIGIQEDLVDELNEIIGNRDFYRATDWENRMLSTEAEGLVDQGVATLSEIRVKRLNRLLITTAVTPTIDTGNSTALDFYYAIWKFPFTASITHQQFAQGLTAELPVYFDKFVMSIGLLIAIIVTANMVPETFESGSLNLLLSKPITRWGLYTSKFVGGCVFIALCACYLFVGVWLWMGLGMQVWDRSMLLSIPLYIVVFAIYFSVSVFVGLLYRSPIVSVILTLLFWAVCFTVGSVYGAVKTKMNNSEWIGLLPMGKAVAASDVLHQFSIWDDTKNQWDQRLSAELGTEGAMAMNIQAYMIPIRDVPAIPGVADFLPPIFDQPSNRIIASRYEFGQFSSSGSKEMFVSAADKIQFKTVGKFPNDTVKLFQTKHGIVAANGSGKFYRLDSEKFNTAVRNVEEKEPLAPAVPPADERTSSTPTVAEEPQPTSPAVAAPTKKTVAPPTIQLFDNFGPLKTVPVRNLHQIDYSVARDEFAIYQNGTINIFRGAADGYQFHASLEMALGFDKGMTAFLAYTGQQILVAFGNGKIITIDAETLQERNEFQPESRSAVRQVAGSPDGRYLCTLYRNGNLWLLDTENGDQMQKAKVSGQGQIGTFAFGDQNQLWVSDNTDRATQYDLATGTRVLRHSPSGDWIANTYRYVLRPFYRVCPKPGEFYKVVTHLSAAGDTSSNENVDLNRTLQASDPWQPLISGAAFMFAMLALGCLVFQFKDY